MRKFFLSREYNSHSSLKIDYTRYFNLAFPSLEVDDQSIQYLNFLFVLLSFLYQLYFRMLERTRIIEKNATCGYIQLYSR